MKTLFEQVKDAVRKGASAPDIAAIYGVSERIVRSTQELLERQAQEKESFSHKTVDV